MSHLEGCRSGDHYCPMETQRRVHAGNGKEARPAWEGLLPGCRDALDTSQAGW